MNELNDADFFSIAFETNAWKNFAIAGYIVSAIIILPAIYGIIWYENYGIHNTREQKLYNFFAVSSGCGSRC